MSKIEVPLVDDRWTVKITEYKGSVNILYNGNIVDRIHHNAKPALLAALLENAGAVKLTFEKGAAAHTGKMGGGVFLEAGTYHVLPIREEGRK